VTDEVEPLNYCLLRMRGGRICGWVINSDLDYLKRRVPEVKDVWPTRGKIGPGRYEIDDDYLLLVDVGQPTLLEEVVPNAHGYLAAIQDLECEFTRMADAGTLQENIELGRALAKAAVWLRRKMDTPADTKETTMSDEEVTKARLAVGLSADRFAGFGGGVGPGMPIVCKCIYCGTLFSSLSHDLADLDHINKGDCGRHRVDDTSRFT
jgi:hypothetical protein